MLSDFFNTAELSSVGRKLLESNRDMIGFALNKGQEVANKGVDFNRDVMLSALDAVASSRIESGRVFEQVLNQGESAQSRVKELLEKGSEQSKARLDQVFETANSHKDSLLNDSFFDSVQSLGNPALTTIQGLAGQLIEAPSKLVQPVTGEEGKPAKKASPSHQAAK